MTANRLPPDRLPPGAPPLSAQREKWVLALVSTFLAYAGCEAVATWLYAEGRIERMVLRVHERTDPQGNIRRDRVLGYRLSPVRSRLVMVSSDGEVLSQGFLQGNNHGFADRRDFERERLPGERRFAVLGDSFTAGRFIEVNWPERAEQHLAGRAGPAIRLWNLGKDGGGLGNWWSLMEHFLGPEGFELDGIVFAVASDDLDRRFLWWDDSVRNAAGSGWVVGVHYSPSWDASRDSFSFRGGTTSAWRVVEPRQLDALLRGEWRPPLDRRTRPYLLSRFTRLALGAIPAAHAAEGAASGEGADEAAAYRRILADMRAFLEAKRLPALVLNISSDPARTADFASALGAELVDHTGLGGASELKIKYDGHWNQRGSDAYARHAAEALSEWSRRVAP